MLFTMSNFKEISMVFEQHVSFCKMHIFLVFFLQILILSKIISTKNGLDKFEKPLPQFRLKMEEVSDNQINTSVDINESHDKFISFLVDNVKELFIQPNNSTLITNYGSKSFDFTPLLNILNFDSISNNIPSPNNSFISDNSLLPFLRRHRNDIFSKWKNNNESGIELLDMLKKIDLTTENPELDEVYNYKRTCIACDNVLNADCTDPKHKLVPAVNCKREDDLCYSQHTPFGIIDRGCFNINHDLTVFVCACNLCNYVSITEMPYIFSSKREWVENVIELSGARRLRKSIFKDMSCLRCEVNVTGGRRDMVTDGYCLEGNIPMLPREVCTADEICAIKAIRNEGYIWRGCVSEPLYNYWWTFCDYDWCNNDVLVSMSDPIY